MYDDKSEGDQNRPTHYLKNFKVSYDPVREIYKAESSSKNSDGSGKQYQVSPFIPLGVSIKRDWLQFIVSFIISLGTFIIVATYTYYAGGQWVEMKRAADATAISSDAAQKAAGAAQTAAHTAQQQLNLAYRPWLAPDATIEVRNNVTTIALPIKNFGSVPAINVGYVFVHPIDQGDNKKAIMQSCELAGQKASEGRYIVPGSGITDSQHTNFAGQPGIVIGCIVYFGPLPGRHHTEVCLSPDFRDPNKPALVPCIDTPLKAD